MMKIIGLLILCFILPSKAIKAEGIRDNWRNWAFLIAHVGYNINSLYWQISQIVDLNKVSLPDNEDDIPEAEKSCGHICQVNSDRIRENSKHAKNLNGVASVVSFSAFLFNGMAFLKLAQNQEINYLLFQNVAKGLSATNSFFNWASMAYLFDSELHYRNIGIPISTQAPLDYAVTNGLGYLLPALPVSAAGLIVLGRKIHQFRALLEARPMEPAEPILP